MREDESFQEKLLEENRILRQQLSVLQQQENNRNRNTDPMPPSTENQANELLSEDSQQIENIYQNIIDQSLLGIAIFQNNLAVFANPVITKLIGYSIDEFNAIESDPVFVLVPPQYQAESRKRYQQILAGEIPVPAPFEYPLKHKNGQIIWVQTFAQHIVFDGHPAVQVFFINITHQKQAEEDFRSLVMNTSQGLLIYQQGSFIFSNPAFEGIFGYSCQELNQLSGSITERIIPEAYRDQVSERLNKVFVLEQPAPYSSQYPIIHKYGEIRWIDVSTKKVEYRGNPAIQMYVTDITKRMQTEEAYRILTQHSLQSLIIFQNNRIVFANPRLEELTGYSIDELKNLENLFIFVHPDDHQWLINSDRELLCGKKNTQHAEYRLIRKNGEMRWVELHSTLIDYLGKPAIHSTLIDISGRKQIQEAYHSLVNESIQGLTIIQNDRIIFSNDSYTQMTGYSLPELYALEDLSLLGHPDDRRMIEERITKILSGKEFRQSLVYRLLRKDGTIRWMETHTTGTAYNGKPSMQNIHIDVTDHKQADEAYQVLVENSLQGLTITQNRRFLFTNKAFAEISGYDIDELLAMTSPYNSLVHPDYIEAVKEREQARLNGQKIPAQTEYPMIRKDGKIRWVETYAVEIEYWGQPALQIATIDITEQKDAEKANQGYIARLETLLEIEKAIVEAQTSNQIADAALKRISKLIPCQYASVAVLNTNTKKFFTLAEFTQIGKSISLPEWADLPRLRESMPGLWSGKDYTTGNLQHESKYTPIRVRLAEYGFHSLTSIPVRKGEELIGILILAERKPDAFVHEHINLAHEVANSLGIAIQQADLLETERRQRREAETLYAAAEILVSSLNLSEVLDNILYQLDSVIPYDSSSIFLLKGNELEIVAFHGNQGIIDAVGFKIALPEESLFLEIQANRRTILIEDVKTDHRFQIWGPVDNVRCWMGVPLISRGDVIGFVTLDSVNPGAFNQDNALLAQAFSNLASVAIENAQLFNQMLQRVQEAETLRDAASSLVSSLDLEEVLDNIMGQLEKVVPYDSASIKLIEGDQTVIVASKGFDNADQVKSLHFPASDPIYTEVVNSEFPLIIEDGAADERFYQMEALSYPIRGWMGIALLRRGEAFGTLNLNNRAPGAYGQKEAELALTFAYQAAVAISNAQMYEQIRQRANELESLATLTNEMSMTDLPEEILPIMIDHAVQLLQADNGQILLDQNNELRVVAESPNESLFTNVSFPSTKTLLWQIRYSDQPIIVEDYSKTQNNQDCELCEKAGALAMVMAPLSTQEFSGVIHLSYDQPRQFSPENLRLLSTIIDFGGNALDRAYVLQTLELRVENRTQELQVLYDVNQTTSLTAPSKSSLKDTLNKILLSIAYDTGTIHILDHQQQKLSLAASVGMTSQTVSQIEEIPLHENEPGPDEKHCLIYLSREAISQNKVVQRNHLKSQQSSDFTGREESDTCIAVPIHINGLAEGIISVFSADSSYFAPEKVSLLSAIAKQIGISLERERLTKETIIMEERQRLARELHDSVTQSLYSIALFANGTSEHARLGNFDKVLQNLETIDKIIQIPLKEMRLMIFELQPFQLEQKGLQVMLRERLQRVEERAGINTQIVFNEEIKFPLSSQFELYRVAQEALNNSLKHASATSMTIRMARHKHQILFEIIDNGLGFDISSLTQTTGDGVNNMQERSKLINGDFSIQSQPGNGTTVRVTFEENIHD
jgi:PAS domain S-box-containing protein